MARLLMAHRLAGLLSLLGVELMETWLPALKIGIRLLLSLLGVELMETGDEVLFGAGQAAQVALFVGSGINGNGITAGSKMGTFVWVLLSLLGVELMETPERVCTHSQLQSCSLCWEWN